MISFAITDKFFAHKSSALQALYAVIDPELNINIVDLGLVYNIDLNEELIKVTMTLSTPHYRMVESIMSAVKNVLMHEFPNYKVEVILI